MIQENAGTSVQAMSLKNMKTMGADLSNLMESAKITPNTINDPNKGNRINLLM